MKRSTLVLSLSKLNFFSSVFSAVQAVACLFIIFSSLNAAAYIPRLRTILAKDVKTHGENSYQIEQEIEIKTASELVSFRESWLVAGPNKMKVRIYGGKANEEKFDFEILYRDGKRFFFENAAQLKAYNLSKDFYESFFHERSTQEFLQRLVRAEVLPNSALQKPKVPLTLAQVDNSPESYLHLGRQAGAVMYAIGEPTPVNSLATKPGIWIEQDSFLIRKIRLKSGSELTADDYKEVDKTMQFPNLRTFTWENKTAVIKTLSVTSIKPEKVENSFRLEEFELKAKKNSIRRSPQDYIVQEFVSRFR